MKLSGRARMIRLHLREDDRWHGRLLHEALIDEARRHDAAGAAAYRGIEGYGASTRIHRKHLSTSSDLPIMVAIIDTEEKITRFCRSSSPWSAKVWLRCVTSKSSAMSTERKTPTSDEHV
jgi:PII-like signaling protein